jgi:hypothetical protein
MQRESKRHHPSRRGAGPKELYIRHQQPDEYDVSVEMPQIRECTDSVPPDPATLSELRTSVRHFVALYRETGVRLFLAVTNYIIDFYCTYINFICCSRNPLLARFSYGTRDAPARDTLVVNDESLPDIINGKEALRGLLDIFRRFNEVAQRYEARRGERVTPQIIDLWVRQNCRYSRLGYGMYRLIEDTGTGLVYSESEGEPTSFQSICNCLSISLLTAVIAEDQGLPRVQITRLAKDCDAAQYCDRKADKHSLYFREHHMDTSSRAACLKKFPKSPRISESGATSAETAEDDLYNFVVMPLEGMIADSDNYDEQRGCNYKAYARILRVLLDTVLDDIVDLYGSRKRTWYDTRKYCREAANTH